MDAIINTLKAQRNQALDTIAEQNQFIDELQARIAELEADLEKTKNAASDSASPSS